MTEQEYRELKAELENSGISLKSQKVILEILKKHYESGECECVEN